MSISELTVSDLLYLLRRQYRSGVHTMNSCDCGKPVVGSGHCADCLTREIETRRVEPTLVAEFRAAMEDKVKAEEWADELWLAIIKQSEEPQ
jgi:hypothetical protein